jgi:hypothetical protein
MMARPCSLAQWLAERGLGEPWISEPGLHRQPGGMSKPAKRGALASLARRNAEHAHARTLAIMDYQAALARGEVREPTRRERLEAAAKGHPDNPSVQAARRLLAKLDQAA